MPRQGVLLSSRRHEWHVPGILFCVLSPELLPCCACGYQVWPNMAARLMLVRVYTCVYTWSGTLQHLRYYTPPRTIIKAGFLDNGGGRTEYDKRDASMQPSRRNLSKATIFVVYASRVLEETGSDIRPRVFVTLPPSVIGLYGIA